MVLGYEAFHQRVGRGWGGVVGAQEADYSLHPNRIKASEGSFMEMCISQGLQLQPWEVIEAQAKSLHNSYTGAVFA